MNKVFGCLFVICLFAFVCTGQTKPKPKPTPEKTDAAKAPIAKNALDRGTVTGRTYRNESLRFEITFPDTWLIPGDDFEAEMKKQGFDLSLKAPANVGLQARAKLNQALKKVTILVTAYRSMPGSAENAIMRVSIEDVTPVPQIKDAVDYFDAMRIQFKAMTLPPDFTYSETQAEQLGRKQFAYLDTSSKSGKKRLYATVRDGFAILFTLSYNTDGDLQTMRQILLQGNFAFR